MSTNPYDSPALDPADLDRTQPRMLAEGYRDQSVGLVLFGLLQMMLGGFSGLLAILMIVAVVAMSGSAQAPGMNLQTTLPGAAMYVLIGVGFIILGIGSIRARRWAWTLTVVLSWLWLALGVSVCGLAVVWLPQMNASLQQQGGIPPQAQLMIWLITATMMAGIYLGLPGVFLLFYHRASVRATCEARDPRIPWTDRCPKRVLALSLPLGFWAAMSLLSVASRQAIFPLFGVLLYGLPGAAAVAALTVVLAGLAWGTYRLKPGAWWGVLLLVVIGALSAWLTFSRVSVAEVYAKMGFSGDQLEAMRRSGMFEWWPLMGTWGSVIGAAVAVGYLLWVRRCFVSDEQR